MRVTKRRQTKAAPAVLASPDCSRAKPLRSGWTLDILSVPSATFNPQPKSLPAIKNDRDFASALICIQTCR